MEMMSAEDDGNDDSVWSNDIDEAFEEALAIYPPCGRRKIILSDEGKMYGRNELIARYIKMRTGKQRSRKQVSSHIQVLARKKQRELSLKLKHCDENIRKTALENLATMSSAQIVSATMGLANSTNNVGGGNGGTNEHVEQSPSMATGPRGNVIGGMGNGMGKDEVQYWDYINHQRQNTDYGRQGMYYGSMPPPPRNEMYPPNNYMGPMGMAIGGYNKNIRGYGPHSQSNYGSVYSGAPMNTVQNVQSVPNTSLMTLPAGNRLCMSDFNAFMEYRWDNTDQYHKHSFVHLSGMAQFCDVDMECVDVRQIYDKFPGVRELYQQGPKHCFYLIKFWADLNYNAKSPEREYLMTGRYDSHEILQIQCSSRVYSFGKQVVEKTQQPQTPTYDNTTGMYVYRFTRTPICEYMVSFVEKLKSLETTEMMNSVLENFSVLQ
eukprot:Ihof_evm1s790 gene=Ihof_evmTU1s790